LYSNFYRALFWIQLQPINNLPLAASSVKSATRLARRSTSPTGMATRMSASLPLPKTAHPTTMRPSTMALRKLRYRASQLKILGLRTRGWTWVCPLYQRTWPPNPDARQGPELRAQGDHDQVSIILVHLSSRASPRPVEGSASGRAYQTTLEARLDHAGARAAWNIRSCWLNFSRTWTRSTTTGT